MPLSEIAILDFIVNFRWDGLCSIRLLILLPYPLYAETRGICCFLNWGQRVNSPYFYIQAGSALGDWSDVIVLYSAPQLVQLKKNNLQSEYFSASCKAHCSVSWEKKVKLFLYLWTVGHCCTCFVSFCTNPECASSRVLKNQSFIPSYNEMLHLFMGLGP